jgi:hypothetical protein
MPELPVKSNPTVEAIYKHYEDNQSDWRRNHLGASLIGRECERNIWYTFRWVSRPKFDGRMLRLFQTGSREEPRLVKNLRDIGVTVWDKDPDSGMQIYYSDMGGHFSGSLDGVGIGFKESEQYHVLEFKTSNNKGFNVLANKGVEVAKFEHFCQMQMYMHWSGVDRAFYFCVNKETDEIYQERVPYRKETALRLTSKAERVIFSAIPTFKIGSEDDHRCRFCDHKETCHGDLLPQVNCRTCSYADPLEDGRWKCCKDDHIIEPIEQRRPHPCHIFIPQLVSFLEQVDANPEKGWIMYAGGITNGPGATLSTDMQKVIDGGGETEPPAQSGRGSEPDMSGVAYDTEFTG